MPCGCAEVCTCFLDSSDTVAVIGAGSSGSHWILVVISDPEGGLVSGPDGVAILVDPASTAPVSVGPDGLRVDCCPAAVMDSETIDFEISGGAVTGEVILDPDAGLESTGSGVGIKVDPASTADVTLGPDGLRVDVDPAEIVANAFETGDFKTAFNPTQSGWLLCDGSLQLAASYPALDALIGSGGGFVFTGGVDPGGGQFGLPDGRGRPVVHVGTHADVNAIGDSDGVAVGARTPNHPHSITHTHGYTPSGTNAANTTGQISDSVTEANQFHTGYIIRESGRTQLIGGPAGLVSVDLAPTGAGQADKFTKAAHDHPVPGQAFTGTAANTGGSSAANSGTAGGSYLVAGHLLIKT